DVPAIPAPVSAPAESFHVHQCIPAIPQIAPLWSDRLLFGPEWLIFGQPWRFNRTKNALLWLLVLGRDVERALIIATRGVAVQCDPASDREDDARVTRIGQRDLAWT